MQEIFVSLLERYNLLLSDPPNISKGYVTISDKPGWGTDLIEKNILKYPAGDFKQVESEPYQEFQTYMKTSVLEPIVFVFLALIVSKFNSSSVIG